MVEGTRAGRYTAFLSYSHKDAAVARRLHQRLESYRIPRRLVGGTVPARLTPIFRDREELPAAGNLSDEVRDALARSEHLIVLCSPSAAASPWVAREIAAYRELRPGRPILAAIVEGEPSACFPPPLSEGGVEPLAADLRPGADGKRLGFLKLVAGLSGVRLDDLVQRDAARQVRRVTAVTLGALAAMLVMAVLTIVALQARQEAERQRAEAEGLVEFMLTDLRDRLKGVGRLDVLAAANQRALRHYAGQDLTRLSDDALERRARILHAMGEDDVARNDMPAARGQFHEAFRTTAALLAQSPEDPKRIFSHAQSEFWVGRADYAEGRREGARSAFLRYKELALRLVAKAPENAEWQREVGYAEGSLCALALEKPVDRQGALSSCAAALSRMKIVHDRNPRGMREIQDVVSRHVWMAEAWKQNERPDMAVRQIETQLGLLNALTASDPKNLDYRDQWVRGHLALAEALISAGRATDARIYLSRADSALAELRAADTANAEWRTLQRRLIELRKKTGERNG